jgi:DNA modification methylase
MIAILQASAFAIPLADSSVQMVVTSPPYFGVRKYAANPKTPSVGRPR